MAGKHMHEAAPSSIFKAGGRREHSGGTATTKTTDDGEAAEGVPWLTGWVWGEDGFARLPQISLRSVLSE